MRHLPWLLVALPAIEMGLSYQLSVGSLLLAILLVIATRTGGLSFTRKDLVAFILLVALIMLSCCGYPGLETWDAQALRVGFQCTLVGAAALSIRGFRAMPPAGTIGQTDINRRTRHLVTLVAGAILVLALAQLATIVATGGNTITMPPSWYALDRPGFVPDPRRPPAFFTEPSYASFVLAALACLNALVGRSIALALALLTATVVCQSASGLIALSIIQAPLFWARWSPRGLTLIAILVASLAAMLILFPEGQLRILDRAMAVGSDESLTIRLANPWIAIDHIWSNDPLGIQQKHAGAYALAHHLPTEGGVPAFVDNGMLNLFIYHGLAGLPILGLMIYCLQLRAFAHICFFLLIGQFNGDWLTPDKIAVLCLVVVLSELAPTAEGGPPPREAGR